VHHVLAEDTTCLAAPHEQSEKVAGWVSMVFMLLVGLSMPGLGGDDDDNSEAMGIGQYILHIAAVSGLMVLGKMFPVFCYRSEADIFTRLALSLGMCPRGEVGAGVIVISLALGVKGNAVPVAVCCLALNIAVSGLFILAATKLVNRSEPKLRRRMSHLFDEEEWMLDEDPVVEYHHHQNSMTVHSRKPEAKPGKIENGADDLANRFEQGGADDIVPQPKPQPKASEKMIEQDNAVKYDEALRDILKNKIGKGVKDMDDIAVQIMTDMDEFAKQLSGAEADSKEVMTV
jgi:hypothetical protein